MDAAHKPVILTYHSITDGSSPIEIPPKIFAEQMEWLATNARVIPLSRLVTALTSRSEGVVVDGKPDFNERLADLTARQALPECSVVLTFDDGFRDFHSNAAPVLSRLNLRAIVFLPTMYVGGKNDWPGQPSWVNPQPLMDWEQVGELAKQGIEFGSHSVTHPDITTLTGEDLLGEYDRSKKEIESKTGQPADFFCYPYGRWNQIVRTALENRYRGACSTGAGVVEANADPFALPRVDAHYVRSMERFRTLFTEGFLRYVTLRRWIRRLRGQPEGIYARV